MTEMCDECGNEPVAAEGDVCGECREDYAGAVADVEWERGEGGWTPGER
jgi:hypothetical protein